jgi:cytochrome c biogenesis protein CcmG, thiol:disulfide interchange protein DsbE
MAKVIELKGSVVGLWSRAGEAGVLRVLFFALFVLFSLSGCGRKEPPAVGVAPPKFTLLDLKGDKVTVPDDFSGKVVVVRFWIDSCKSCEKEMPEIDQLYNKYKDKGLVVLAINVGQSKSAAETFATRLHLTYPVLLDTNSATSERYGVKAVPFTFVVDKKGIITKRILGETERESFEKMIQGLL